MIIECLAITRMAYLFVRQLTAGLQRFYPGLEYCLEQITHQVIISTISWRPSMNSPTYLTEIVDWLVNA